MWPWQQHWGFSFCRPLQPTSMRSSAPAPTSSTRPTSLAHTLRSHSRTRTEPWVDRDASVALVPPLRELISTVKKHGSPLHDDLVPDVVTEPSPEAKESALLELAAWSFPYRARDSKRYQR